MDSSSTKLLKGKLPLSGLNVSRQEGETEASKCTFEISGRPPMSKSFLNPPQDLSLRPSSVGVPLDLRHRLVVWRMSFDRVLLTWMDTIYWIGHRWVRKLKLSPQFRYGLRMVYSSLIQTLILLSIHFLFNSRNGWLL